MRGGQVVGIAPTERLKLRRKMAAAACKKKSVLEVEEQQSTMAGCVDMRVVCPQDVQQVLLKQARLVGPLDDMGKQRTNGVDKRSVAGANPSRAAKEDQQSLDRQAPTCDEEVVVEGGLVWRRSCDTGWSDEKKCEGCDKEEHGEAQVEPLSIMEGSQKPDPGRAGKMGTEGQDFEGRLEAARRNHVALSEWMFLRKRPHEGP